MIFVLPQYSEYHKKKDINFNVHSCPPLQLQSVESPIHVTISHLVLCIMDIVSNVMERKKVAMCKSNSVGKTGVMNDNSQLKSLSVC